MTPSKRIFKPEQLIGKAGYNVIVNQEENGYDLQANSVDGGGAAQTLQEVLTEGSVLTEDAEINGGGNFGIEILNTTYAALRAGVGSDEALVYVEENYAQLKADDDNQIELGAGTATLKKGGVTKPIATVNYLVYTALLSQSGTDAPVATVLENTLGGTVVWTRADVGDYRGELTGAFVVDKTIFLSNNDSFNGNTYSMSLGRVDSNTVVIKSFDNAAAPIDSAGVNSIHIEIRVYQP